MARSADTRNSGARDAPVVVFDGLEFRTQEEFVVYRELRKAQGDMPEFDAFSILTNCPVRAVGQTFVVDLLVVHRSAAGVIEVDGSFHARKWASDRSRDQLLEDSGIAFVHRIDVRDVHDPNQLERFVRRFLSRLHQRAAA